jgi:Glycine zipper
MKTREQCRKAHHPIPVIQLQVLTEDKINTVLAINELIVKHVYLGRLKMKKYFYLLTMVTFLAAISGCANPYNNEGEGAVTGGVLGAVAGGVIGHQSHDTGAGMLIGGALGAATGAVVGSHIQKPEPPPGQVIVAQPAPAASSTTYSGDTVTVSVPNSNGGYTAVVLKRSGNGYVGPQGEYYDQVPTTAQLQAMYGS